MKVKAFIISGLLAIFSIVQVWASNLDLDDQTSKTNLIKLASAKVLQEDINQTSINSYFLEEAQLHTQLGGTSRYLEGIRLVIDSAIYDYLDSMKAVSSSAQMFALSEEMYINRTLLENAVLKTAKPDFRASNELVIEKANDDLLLRYTAM